MLSCCLSTCIPCQVLRHFVVEQWQGPPLKEITSFVVLPAEDVKVSLKPRQATAWCQGVVCDTVDARLSQFKQSIMCSILDSCWPNRIDLSADVSILKSQSLLCSTCGTDRLAHSWCTVRVGVVWTSMANRQRSALGMLWVREVVCPNLRQAGFEKFYLH